MGAGASVDGLNAEQRLELFSRLKYTYEETAKEGVGDTELFMKVKEKYISEISQPKQLVFQRAKKRRKSDVVYEQGLPQNLVQTSSSASLQLERSENEQSFLRSALRRVLFDDSGDEEIENTHVLDAMRRQQFRNGEEIICEGEPGDKFFVITEGEVQYHVAGKGVVGKSGPGSYFGELALIYDALRGATVTSLGSCVAWSLGRLKFREIQSRASADSIVQRSRWLRKVKILEALSSKEITLAAGAMRSEKYTDGQYIIRQGETGDRFYVILKGCVSIVLQSSLKQAMKRIATRFRAVRGLMGAANLSPRAALRGLEPGSLRMPQEVNRLFEGDYFGEAALLTNQKRNASIIAVGEVQCLSLGREEFTELLGPLQQIMEDHANVRQLRSVVALADMSEKALVLLARRLKPRTVPAGDVVAVEGKVPDCLFLVRRGAAKASTAAGLGDVILGAGEHFGEGCVTSEPSAVTVTALEDLQCMVLNTKEGRALNKAKARRKSLTNEAAAVKRKLRRSMTGSLRLQDLEVVGCLGEGSFARVFMVKVPFDTSSANGMSLHSMSGHSLRACEAHSGSDATAAAAGDPSRSATSRSTSSGSIMALKRMSKAHLVSSDGVRQALSERKLMAGLEPHPFVAQLHAASQDKDCLYMLLDCVQGGELFSVIHSHGTGNEAAARFYAANIFLALEHLHHADVMYRDLKPENVLLRPNGYIKLIDLGFAKKLPYTITHGDGRHETLDRSFTLCGTPEYLSPELVLNLGHDAAVDYWALGVLTFEMVFGRTPFESGAGYTDMFRHIAMTRQHGTRPRFPDGFAEQYSELADFITQLLEGKVSRRLGVRRQGSTDVRRHPWFAALDWDMLLDMTSPAPHVPVLSGPFDLSNFDAEDHQELVDVEPYNDDDGGAFEEW